MRNNSALNKLGTRVTNVLDYLHSGLVRFAINVERGIVDAPWYAAFPTAFRRTREDVLKSANESDSFLGPKTIDKVVSLAGLAGGLFAGAVIGRVVIDELYVNRGMIALPIATQAISLGYELYRMQNEK
jgi:hypothetical protein